MVYLRDGLSNSLSVYLLLKQCKIVTVERTTFKSFLKSVRVLVSERIVSFSGAYKLSNEG